MPALGLGVYDMTDRETEATVLTALELGYRSIDTAAVYDNEVAVGRGLAASGLPRSDLFVTTKLWGTEHAPPRASAALHASLERLGLDFVDLYLIHWPQSTQGLYVQAWEQLLQLREAGLARDIGVCNFLPRHIEELASAGLPLPAVNQIEIHPFHQQEWIRDFNRSAGISTEAWAPLGRMMVLESPAIVAIANEVGRTPAQVVLRWHLQSGHIVIPKSVSPRRLAENIDVFDFDLTQEQLASIATLDAERMVDPALLRFQ